MQAKITQAAIAALSKAVDSPLKTKKNGRTYLMHDTIKMHNNPNGYGLDVEFWYRNRLVSTMLVSARLVDESILTLTGIEGRQEMQLHP